MIAIVYRSGPRTRRVGFRGGLVAAAALALLVSAPVTAHDPDPTFGGGLMTPGSVLAWDWAAGGVPPSAMRAAIRAGAADANASTASRAPTFARSAGASNAIYYGTSVPCGVNGLACMRRSTPSWFGVWLRENGHRFDWGTLRWCEMTGSPNGCYQAETITLDELGHVLGLDHHVNYGDDRDYADAVVQTYSHTRPGTGWNADAFARCDVAALQQMYDVATSTTRYSTCLDVPTTLALVTSSTLVTPGTTVTLTATLRSDGSGRLANNAISSRTVVLQEHVATGWSDVLSMDPLSGGRYETRLKVGVTTEYRARFRSPSDEGLRGSTSPSVTVTVTWACVKTSCAVL